MRIFALLLFIVGLFTIASLPVTAGEKGKPAFLAKHHSAVGTLLVRTSPDGPWTMPELNSTITRDAEVLTLPGARGVLESKGGAVRLSLIGNLPGLSPGAVRESAVRIHDADGKDLDLTLERGRILIENRKNAVGKVRVRILEMKFHIDLDGKDAAVALELSTRWPAGMIFTKKPKQEVQPIGELHLLVIKGKVELELGKEKQVIEEPVSFRWTTHRDREGPNPLEKAPAWLHPDGDISPKATALHAAVEKVRRSIVSSGLEKGLAQAMGEKSPTTEAAIFSAGAAGKFDLVWLALNEGKNKEAREAAANALRSRIDHGQKQALGVYDSLVLSKVKAGQAEIVMELLHGFGTEARNRPETYSTLITYLGSDMQAIRELAHRNLAYLVPAGKEIAFDAAASAEQRADAEAAWRKLIPEGQVPK